MHIEGHSHCLMHYFGVKTLFGTLFSPPLRKPGYGARFFRSDGDNNHAGLRSANVDDLLDWLSEAEEGKARVCAAASTHAAILAEVPWKTACGPRWYQRSVAPLDLMFVPAGIQ